ncbi:PaaI family thioesterase [Chloroflexota bacterium]
MVKKKLADELIEKFRQKYAHLTSVEVPPKIFLDMEGEFIAYDESVMSLTVRFPVKERYQNPMLTMQGGMIVAAVDNAFGPLSFLVAPPSITTQLNTSFIKAVRPSLPYIDVTARVDELTRRFLFMSARVTNPEGELLALSQASFMILRGPR